MSNSGPGDWKLKNRRCAEHSKQGRVWLSAAPLGRKRYNTSVSKSSWTDCAGLSSVRSKSSKTLVGSSWTADRRSHIPHLASLCSTATVSSIMQNSDLTSVSLGSVTDKLWMLRCSVQHLRWSNSESEIVKKKKTRSASSVYKHEWPVDLH